MCSFEICGIKFEFDKSFRQVDMLNKIGKGKADPRRAVLEQTLDGVSSSVYVSIESLQEKELASWFFEGMRKFMRDLDMPVVVSVVELETPYMRGWAFLLTYLVEGQSVSHLQAALSSSGHVVNMFFIAGSDSFNAVANSWFDSLAGIKCVNS
ncbi:MAG: hypothetical protein Q3999_04030 [Buchananella hordeovulneris]|nr:hypothetical protein [Buchananella hordeovulneris]